MKKIITCCLSALLVMALTSCFGGKSTSSSGKGGEVVGVGGGRSFREPAPYGMTLVKRGWLKMGIEKQDSLWGKQTPVKDISVDGFWMDETEVTNSEYKQFVNWVRDSILRTRLADPSYGGDETYMITEDKNGDPVKPHLNWKKNLPRKPNEDEQRAIESLYTYNPVTGEKMLDASQMNYRYGIYDYTTAALRRNRLRVEERNLNTDVVVDPNEVVMISKDTAYIDDEGRIVRETINRPLSGPWDFLNTYIVNIYPDIIKAPVGEDGTGGLLYYFFKLDEWSILPSLIFMGVGAMTDFGPLIANPKSFLLGAAAQFGIYGAYFFAIFMGFGGKAAAAISIIGGADGPTSIFLAGKLGQTALLGPIAVAAYSYMSLVPIIQPPIMKLLTTEKERKIKMEQLRPVSKLEKILFPIIVAIVVCMILPTTAPLVGMLMLGNLFRESGVVRQLQDTASNALMYIVVILLGTSVGATTSAEAFLNVSTIKIVILGLLAFCIGTAAGVLFGKIMCVATRGKVNPLIGSAGVSAVPMAARVSQKVGTEADPSNFLLMHAMGPNVAGVIGTAVAAGTFMAIFGI